MPSPSRRRRLVDPALCAVAVLLWSGATLRAHESGTTHVSVLFTQGRTHDVEIVTDAAALVEKLQAAANASSSPADTGPTRLQSRLARFDEQFRQRVTIGFDTSNVRPLITTWPRAR